MKKSFFVALAALAAVSQAQANKEKPEALRRLELRRASESAAKGVVGNTGGALAIRALDLSSAGKDLTPSKRIQLSKVASTITGASDVIETAVAHLDRPEVRSLAEATIEGVSNLKLASDTPNTLADQAHTTLVLSIAKHTITLNKLGKKNEKAANVVESLVKISNSYIAKGKTQGEALELAIRDVNTEETRKARVEAKNAEEFKLEVDDINRFCKGGLSLQCTDVLSTGRKPIRQFAFRVDSKIPALQELNMWFKGQDTLRFFPSADYLIPGFDGMNRQHGQFFTLTHVLKTLNTDLSNSMISSKKAQDQQKRDLDQMKKQLAALEMEMAELPKKKEALEAQLKKDADYADQAPSVLGETRIGLINEQVDRLASDVAEVKFRMMKLPSEKANLAKKIEAEETSVADNTIGEAQKKLETRTREFVIAAAELLGSAVSKHFRTEEAMLIQKVQDAGNLDSKFHQDYLAKHFEEHRAFEREMDEIIQGIRGLGTSPQEIKDAARSLAIKIDTWLILHIKVNDTLTYNKMSN